MNNITIGLFGTCGQSTWREAFIKKYTRLGISFFNPQVPDGTWHAGCVAEENKHLVEDDIILFPVLSETTGQGSLAEIGFSINAALKRNPDRYFIFLIDNECTDVNASAEQRKESNRTRVLVKSKLILENRKNSGIFIAETLDEMFELSIKVYNGISYFKEMRTAAIK